MRSQRKPPLTPSIQKEHVPLGLGSHEGTLYAHGCTYLPFVQDSVEKKEKSKSIYHGQSVREMLLAASRPFSLAQNPL